MAVHWADGSDGAEMVPDDLWEAASQQGAAGPGRLAGTEPGAGRGEGTWGNRSCCIGQQGLPSGIRERHRETSVTAGARRHREKSILLGTLKSTLLPGSLLKISMLVLPQATAVLGASKPSPVTMSAPITQRLHGQIPWGQTTAHPCRPGCSCHPLPRLCRDPLPQPGPTQCLERCPLWARAGSDAAGQSPGGHQGGIDLSVRSWMRYCRSLLPSPAQTW